MKRTGHTPTMKPSIRSCRRSIRYLATYARGTRRAQAALIAMMVMTGLQACGKVDALAGPNSSSGVVTHITFGTVPASTQIGTMLPSVHVYLMDGGGNVVTSANDQVTLAFGNNPTSANLSGTLTINAVNGVAAFNDLSVDKIGDGYTLLASSASFSDASSATFDVMPGAASQLMFVVEPPDVAPGMSFPVAVQVAITDAMGNIVNNSTDAVTLAIGINPSAGTLLGTRTVNAVNGVASFGGLSIDQAGIGYTLVASSGSLTNDVSIAFDVRAGAAARLSFSGAPSTSEAGDPIGSVVVIVEDAFGNPAASSAAVTIALGSNPGGSTLSGTTTVNAVNGVAVFGGLWLDKVSSGYTFVATATSLPSATSAPFEIIPGVAAQMSFTVQPVNAVAGPFPAAVQVTLLDAFSNVATAASGAVTLSLDTNPGSGTLTGTKTVSAVNGRATFSNLTLDKAASGYVLGAVSGGLPYTVSNSFDVSPGAPARLAFAQEPTDSDVAVPFALPIQVAIQDAYGNTITSATDAVTMFIGSNPSGAKLLGSATVAAVGGVASFLDLSIDRSGDGFSLRAAAGSYPTQFSGVFNVELRLANIDGGGHHTCGVNAAGVAYCWGYNAFGQVGDGSTSQRLAPVPVNGGHTFVNVSGGYYHSCGVTTAGQAYCWGRSNNGQIGDGTTATRTEPRLVNGGLTFTSVSTGFYHSCGVTSTGAAYCWGRNSNGQLGDGTTAQRTSPVLVSGGLNFASLTVGDYHSCGITTAGAAYCWGRNSQGQLGDGTLTQRTSPVAVNGGLTFANVTGGFHHSCGVTTGGAGYCWGYNAYGQLGDNTTTRRTSPVAVGGGLTLAEVAVGFYHTCGVTTSNQEYCWGRNNYGQLGDGTTGTRRLPVMVTGGLSFAGGARKLGSYHSCGVTTTGEAYCWGRNANGQLGNQAANPARNPIQVGK